ncbi:MAG: G5 domain-containing protein [Oscillospiraceae bacterium]|nr:G5 domain-containing protein [Oscillospiraceae bacterium]
MKRRIVSVLGAFALVFAICSAMFFMTGCGKDVKIKINDTGVTTEADANTGMTIEEILENAGVTLGEKDETDPKADEKLGDATEITVKRYAKVTVKNGNDEKVVELVGGTVEDAVKKAGFTLDDSVNCDVDKSSYLKDKMVITLTNSVEVSFKADGKTDKCKTFAKTVKEFLEEQKITLGKNDTVSPKLEEKITSGMKITVKRVEYKNKKVKESIDFQTEEQQSSSLNSGETQVTQEGVNGEKEVTYKVKYVDGKETSKKKISEKVTKEPVNKIVTVGTAQNTLPPQTTPQQTQNDSSQSGGANQGGKQVVSKQAVYDCDGSGHGYYVITYSDGTTGYEEF